MSLPNAVIDAMLAAGCSAEQLAAAMKAANAEVETRREAKRAGNAERQQRFRDRRKGKKDARNDSNALRDVTPPIDRTHTPQSDISPDGESQDCQRDDCARVQSAWNEMAKAAGLSLCAKLDGKRRKSCQARLRADGLDAIQRAIEKIPKSTFLRGETGDWSGASIDFLLRTDSVTKILEGKYDDRTNPVRHSSGSTDQARDNRDGFTRAIDRRLGLEGSPGTPGRPDAGEGGGYRQLPPAAA